MSVLAGLEMREVAGAVRFAVHARPRAKTTHLGGVREGALVVRIAAPPVEGAANAALVAFLAEVLDVSRAHVRLVRGDSGRAKLVEVRGLATGDGLARLEGAMERSA